MTAILIAIVRFFLQPLGLILVLVMMTALAAILQRSRLSAFAGAAAVLLIVICGWTNAGRLAMQPLEQRFVRPEPAPPAVTGIIVLGGGMAGMVNLARGGYELDSSGDRFLEAAVLARRYPDARIVISGGSGAQGVEGETDAASASRLFTALGVAEDRLVLEDRSRNTAENALFTREMVQPSDGETWLLITSAFHMPRAMELFRRAGFPVTPWPVDYRTTGHEDFGRAKRSPVSAFEEATLAIREWSALAGYRLMGRTGAFLPKP